MRMYALWRQCFRTEINVKVKLLLIMKEHCDIFILKIYSTNELLKKCSLSPQECLTMGKK